MKRTVAILLSLALMLFGISALAEETQSFTPGTYTGEGQGIRSTIKVEVTFSEDAITDIQLIEHGETRNIADAAIDAIPAAVLESQSIAVDAVSSVTFTSRGLLAAIQDACEQAGGNLDLLKQKPEIAPAEDEELTTDVVVVGMGLAGVAASLSALDEGAQVIAIEKASAPGGSSKYSGGFITGIGTELQQEIGFDMDVDAYMDYFNSQEDMSVKADETDRDATRAMIERSAADIEFLEAHGDPITGPDGFGSPFTVWHYPATRTNAFDGEAAGADHIVALMKTLNENENFSIHYDARATEILTDEDGKACGIVATRKDGSTLTVRAGAVVLATGGWAASKELMERFAPSFPQEWVLPYTTSSMQNTGDGILMAEAIGADIYEDGWWMDLAIGIDAGGYATYFPDTLNGLINYNNYYVVDGEGARIFNVNSLYGPRSIAFSDAMARTGKIFSIMTAEGFPAGIEYIENNDRVDNKNVFKADTLEELAELTGMDVETFVAGVERYNGFCETGVDEDMGQMTLIPIGDGPYYALNIKTITMGTIGGVKTDDDNRVLNQEGEAIDGLFAAGEIINGKYFNQVYVSGCAQLLCTDSGILAGRGAAQAALQ
ncbi:MAG: FAD-dependent oxidoreductase [Clostridia bacterium]|nr:FAD-dependent oxidoreductase [Clostridia bacterium]